ncbi:MAG: sulfatase-like hydrolase/transferase, partial [Planctomycetota bacterium]
MKTVFICLAACSWAIQAAASERPNVVVIFVDDLGYADPSCFGNPAMRTPNIDRLAEQGIRLTNFYVNSPICSASRVALTTGQYPQRHRIHSFLASRASNRRRKMPDWLDPNAPTLAKILKGAGYQTAHFGKWHMGGGRDVGDAPLPQAYGFDESLVAFEGLGDRILWSRSGAQGQSRRHGRGEILDLPKHKTTETYVDRAIEFIGAHRNEPFYMRVCPNDVHDEHIPSDRQRKKWEGRSDNPPDDAFFAVLDEMDRQIGRLVAAIDDLGLGEETLILFTSDNGPTDWPRYYEAGADPPGFTGPLFGRKWSLYEGGIRMPFIARWKGQIPTGAVNDTTVMAAIDVLPTIAALCGLEGDEPTDGLDLSAALTGAPIVRTQPIFWEYGVHGSIKPGLAAHISPHLAMRDGDWKLLCNPDGSDPKLFNLRLDLGEKENVAEQNAEVASRMQTKLLDWWASMNAHYESAADEPAADREKPAGEPTAAIRAAKSPAPAFVESRQPDAAVAKKPNIVFLFADDQRAGTLHLGGDGNQETITPNLDALAQRGLWFRNAYVFGADRGSVCYPSRAQLLSGKSLFHSPLIDSPSRSLEELNLPAALKLAGYQTMRSGKANNVPYGINVEFDVNIERAARGTVAGN